MENSKDMGNKIEVKDEELEEVAGGVILRGKPPFSRPEREKPISDGAASTQPRR